MSFFNELGAVMGLWDLLWSIGRDINKIRFMEKKVGCTRIPIDLDWGRLRHNISKLHHFLFSPDWVKKTFLTFLVWLMGRRCRGIV